jgi:hypothetical protein
MKKWAAMGYTSVVDLMVVRWENDEDNLCRDLESEGSLPFGLFAYTFFN